MNKHDAFFWPPLPCKETSGLALSRVKIGTDVNILLYHIAHWITVAGEKQGDGVRWTYYIMDHNNDNLYVFPCEMNDYNRICPIFAETFSSLEKSSCQWPRVPFLCHFKQALTCHALSGRLENALIRGTFVERRAASVAEIQQLYMTSTSVKYLSTLSLFKQLDLHQFQSMRTFMFWAVIDWRVTNLSL